MNPPDQVTTQVSQAAESGMAENPVAPGPGGAQSQAASLLMGVRLPIRVLLGRTQLSLREITELGNGAVVELDCSPNDPVQLMVNGRVIAYGEIVMVGGNYGIRITKIPTREEGAEVSGPEHDLLRLSENLR
jgi:flagellar motor switch protein FliN/FliY